MNYRTARNTGLCAALAASLLAAAVTPAPAQKVSSDFKGAQDFGGGWFWVEWFDFFNANFYPWIFKSDGGWFYVDGDDGSLFLWSDGRKDWVWTNKDNFPWYVSFGDGQWRQYPDGINSPPGSGGGGDEKIGVVRANMSLGNVFNSGHRATIEEIAAKGGRRLRLTFHTDEELPALTSQINYATANGLDVAITIVFGTETEYMENGSKQRGGGVVSDAVFGLSDINLDGYEKWIKDVVDQLKDAGATISEIEVGNEPNWFDFNGDLPVVDGGQTIRRKTHDFEDIPKKVVEGAQKLGQAYEITLSAVRSKLGGGPVVMLGSLPKVPNFWVGNFNGTLVYPEDWLRLMKGTYPGQNGTDRLKKVEAYGFHFYPSLDFDSESKIKDKTADYIDNFVGPVVDVIGTGKPFYITELGISKSQITDPSERLKMFEWTLETLSEKSPIKGWPWKVSYIYAWDDGEWGIDGSKVTDIFERFPK